MKKYLSLVLLSAVVFLAGSCKKEMSENADYYISANVNGVVKTYKAEALAVKLKMDNNYSIGLSAKAAAGSPEQFMLSIVQSNSAIVSGSYVDQGNANPNLVVVSGYNPGTTNDALVYAAGLQEDNNPRLRINITVSDKTVSGTFSGTYYDHGGDGPGTIPVTEGKFSLPLVQ